MTSSCLKRTEKGRSTSNDRVPELETQTFPSPRLTFSASPAERSTPESTSSSSSAPWSSKESPKDSLWPLHLPPTDLEPRRLSSLSSSSLFSVSDLLSGVHQGSQSPEVVHRASAEAGSVIRLSRHSRSLSGLSGSSRASLPMTPLSDYMPPPPALSFHDDSPPQQFVASSQAYPAPRRLYSRERELSTASVFSQSDAPEFSKGQEKQAIFLNTGARPSSSRSADDDSGGIGPVRSKKAKEKKTRERLRIALDPDQPPTTHGKQRERVYVACRQCRGRKIRCDGANPMCFNCNQRGSSSCDYDALPKRRGPDRQPGSRQRGKGSEVKSRRRISSKTEVVVAAADPSLASHHHSSHSPSGSISYAHASPELCNASIERLSPTAAYVPPRFWTQLSTPPDSSHSGSHGIPQSATVIPLGLPVSQSSSQSSISPFSFDPHSQYMGSDGLYPTGGYPIAHARPYVHQISTDVSYDQSAPTSHSTLYSPTSANDVIHPPFTNPFLISNERVYVAQPIEPHLGQEGNDYPTGNANLIGNVVDDIDTNAAGILGPPSNVSGVDPSQPYQSPANVAVQRHPHLFTIPLPYAPQPNGSFLDSIDYNPYQWAVGTKHTPDRTSAFISSVDENAPFRHGITSTRSSRSPSMYQTPSFDFVRKTWWDSLLDTYCVEPYCSPTVTAYYRDLYNISVATSPGTFATGTARYHTSQIVVRDIQALFKQSNFWFAFMNYPRFFNTFYRARDSMQPALILAILTFSNLMRSSSAELGMEGIRRTLWLKEKAQAALDAAIAVNAIDPDLASAAWLLCVFEISSQPMRSSTRIRSSFETLDNIIRSLSLSYIDQSTSPTTLSQHPFDPNASSNSSIISHILPSPLYNRSPMYPTAPSHRNNSQLLQYRPDYTPLQAIVTTNGNAVPRQDTCRCNQLCLGHGWKEAAKLVPFWLCTPMWNPKWTEAELRREECRRLCWCTLLLFASYTSYCASLGINMLDLFLLRPNNYHNVFPGENLDDAIPFSTSHGKLETVWALYSRSMLLWHACLRISNVTDSERAVFSNAVWLEAEAIENSLDGHTCDTERAFLYQGREYLFNARMFVTQEFRRFVPHPSLDMTGAVHRLKAEEYLTHQASLCKRVMQGLQTVTGLPGNMLGKRPFFTAWFMAHISRCINLWQADTSLVYALELAKNFMAPIDYLAALWPSEEQRNLYVSLHTKLSRCCQDAGLAPPPPIDLTFPLPPSLTILP